MTDPHAPEPLAPDVVDELLSALFDGELDAAAHAHGMTAEDARARLDATPGVEARRASLEAARDAIAAVPSLDELTQRRLVGGAAAELSAPARSRIAPRLLAAAGIAAAVAAVVALVTVPNWNGAGENASSSNAIASATTAGGATHTKGVAGAPGAIENEQQLRRFLDDTVGRTMTQSNKAAAPSSTSPTGTAPGGSFSSRDQAAGEASSEARAACPASVRKELGVDVAPRASANVTHEGRPAVVVVFSARTGNYGVLYDPGTCRIIISTFRK
jgi:hypothetical protein